MARKISNSVKSTQTTDHKTYITFSFFNLSSVNERLKNRPYTIILNSYSYSYSYSTYWVSRPRLILPSPTSSVNSADVKSSGHWVGASHGDSDGAS